MHCPVNFGRLTLGALRKYQYKFRLRMGPNDKPLLSREDLIDAIQRHFVLEMKVDHHEEIGKFLSLKREEARSDLVIGPRRGGDKPRNLRNRGNPKPNNQAANNQQAAGGGGNANVASK